MLFGKLLWATVVGLLPLSTSLALENRQSEELIERGHAAPYFYKGHDLSSLKIMEDGGAIYKDTMRNNRTRPAEDILGDGGMNTVRLRLWVHPKVPFDDGCKEMNLCSCMRDFVNIGFRLRDV